ncbi:MAG TPA: LysE family translocator [Xanthobacteraceae bacterium]|jgi:homoserine/homoserine lactone efflux protein|nr:LysE family translocator [Xanthobacteraceae bacterium]
MSVAALIAFIVTSLALDFTPGPAVLKVVGDSMAHGWQRTQPSIAGILVANAVYCLLSAAGLAALVLAFPVLFDFIKWMGMLYLGWIGLRSLQAALFTSEVRPGPTPVSTPGRLFYSSFVLQGANPKAVLYYVAILPAFAGDSEHAAKWFLLLGMLEIAMEYPALLFYSLVGGGLSTFASRRLQRALDALAGVAVIGAAAMVARSSLQQR